MNGINISEIIGKIKRAGNKSLGEVAENIRRRMSEEGKPIRYPVKWDSARQRKAYFASNGFGHGIPFRRKGHYQKGWAVKAVPFGYELSNAHPAGAIGGMPETGWQSRIHRGRWNYLPKIFGEEVRKLIPSMLENLRVEFS
jgi:hypothetical protein